MATRKPKPSAAKKKPTPRKPDVAALLNAELEGFNDKRAMETDEPTGAWVVDAVKEKGKHALVTAHNDLQRVKLDVPVVYEIIEANGTVDSQFFNDLLNAIIKADEATAPEVDASEKSARALLKNRDAKGLASHLRAMKGDHARYVMLSELLEFSEEASAAAAQREAFVTSVVEQLDLVYFDDLKAELCLFALWTENVAVLNRLKPRLAPHDLRPYGPLSSTVRSWEMRGLKPGAAARAFLAG